MIRNVDLGHSMKDFMSSTSATNAFLLGLLSRPDAGASNLIHPSLRVGLALTELQNDRVLNPFFGSIDALTSMHYRPHPMIELLGKETHFGRGSPGFGRGADVWNTNRNHIARYNTTFPLPDSAVKNIDYRSLSHAGSEGKAVAIMMDSTLHSSAPREHCTRSIVNPPDSSSINSKNKKPIFKSSRGDDNGRVYIDKIRELDVLCGRGRRSTYHCGNKFYRQVVNEMKRDYRSTKGDKGKTNISQAIVDHVMDYGGRFVKKEDSTGRYYVISHADARKKTSQALREIKETK